MTKHCYRTHVNRDGTAYAMIAKLAPHRYPKASAYGERVVLKPVRWLELGRFLNRPDAVRAAKDAISLLEKTP